MTTVYRTRITKLPGHDELTPEYWQVELMTHTEDGPQVEFVGEFFEEADANRIAAAWRSAETRDIVWLCASLARPAWHDNQEGGNGDWVATVHNGIEEDEFNARLIAEAPAMLALLEWFNASMRDDSVDDIGKFINEMEFKCSSVIRKVRGE